jgi:hypothetical protein
MHQQRTIRLAAANLDVQSFVVPAAAEIRSVGSDDNVDARAAGCTEHILLC